MAATDDGRSQDLSKLAKKGWPASAAATCPNLSRAMLRGLDPTSVDDRKVSAALRSLIQEVAAADNGTDSDWVLAGADLVGVSSRSRDEIRNVIGAVSPSTREGRLRLAGSRVRITSDRRAKDHESKMLGALLSALDRFLVDDKWLRNFQVQHDLRTDGAGSGPTLRRLQRWSNRLQEELNTVASVGDHPTLRLSDGLYVTRTQQQSIIDDVLSQRRGPATVVHGDAGQGKSSLLWSIYRQLNDDPQYDMFLISATWLSAGGGPTEMVLTLADLQQAITEARSRGREPVMLIDTVDVMLHDDPDRFFFFELCDVLVDDGARLLLACRPEEAASFPKDRFATVKLEPYDTLELREAVKLHVATFCPDAPPRSLDEKLETIVGSVSNGLPVREVCINPLMLRMLFELHAPYFPLMEMDTSGLYRLYWEQRVKRDPRTGLSVGSTDDARQDLSTITAQLAVVLLGLGRLELEPTTINEHIGQMEGNWPSRRLPLQRTIDGAITALVRRGVLVRTGKRLRFFHQTIFEYAAARGLRSRDGINAITFLGAHLKSHPDDLFRAAVLEQLLILCLEDPAIVGQIDGAIAVMATSDVPSLQRSAMAAMAHRPEYLIDLEGVIDAASISSLRRFGQIVPTVSDTRVPDVVSALCSIWKRAQPCRITVLEAFERVAARESAPVVGALRDLDCVNYVLGLTKDASLSAKLLCRALAASASADRRWVGSQLLVVFDRTAARTRKGRELPLYVLTIIEHHWSSLTAPGFLKEVEDAVIRLQTSFDASALRMRTALGGVLAAAWMQNYSLEDETEAAADFDVESWLAFVDGVCSSLERDDYDVLINARVIGIARRIGARADSSVASATVRRFLAIQSTAAVRAMSRTAFPVLLSDTSDSLIQARSLLLSQLAALPESPEGSSGSRQHWAAIVRNSLLEASITPAELADLLEDVPVTRQAEVWLSERGLVSLLVKASVGGHSTAREALADLAADSPSLSKVARDLLSRSIRAYVAVDPSLVGVLVDLSLARRSGTELSEVVLEYADQLHEQLVAESGKLRRLIDTLLTMGGGHQREGASLWLRLDAAEVLPSPHPTALRRALSSVVEPAAVGNLLRLAAQAAESERFPIGVADELLCSRFRVEGQPPKLVRPARSGPDDVAGVAREAWLRMVCSAVPTDELDTSALLTIASAEPVLSNSFGFFQHLIIRLATSGRVTEAADLISTVAVRSVEAGLSPKAELKLANVMRGAMRATFRRADPTTREQLLDVIPTLPKGHGRILVSAAAQECFDAVHPQLTALLNRDLPQGVVDQILNEMDVRRRHGGGTLLRLLRPLEGWEAETSD